MNSLMSKMIQNVLNQALYRHLADAAGMIAVTYLI